MRMITKTTLVLLFTIMIACAAYTDKQTQINERQPIPAENIFGVVLPVTIEGFVLKSGDSVIFQDGTGIYDDTVEAISGTLADATPVSAALNQIELILLKWETISGSESISVDPIAFIARAKQKPWRTINGVTVQDGATVRFKKPGAVYLPMLHLIRGITIDDMSVGIDSRKVCSVITKKLSPVDTAANTVIYGAGFATYVFILALGTYGSF